MDNMQNMGANNVCKCPHHKVVPILVILFGLTFLLQAWNIVTPAFAMTVWPILVIIGGATKLTGKMCKCC